MLTILLSIAAIKVLFKILKFVFPFLIILGLKTFGVISYQFSVLLIVGVIVYKLFLKRRK